MTEEKLDRMLRDADPYRPVGNLDEERAALLEEIMSDRTIRRGPLRRFAGALVAAAVLVVALVAATVLRGHPAERHEAVGPSGSPVVFSPAAVKAAEGNPRLLVDQPGWKIDTVYGFATAEGTIRWVNGGNELEINWRPADEYAQYYESRSHVSAPQPKTVADWAGDEFRYSDNDFAVMLKPRDNLFAEIRAQGWSRTQLDEVLSHVVRADVRTFLAALPPEVVTPDRVDEAAAAVLADIPLPPGFDRTSLADGGANDAYQFGATVTSKVGCAWIAEWKRAEQAGDDAALQKAADALRSSHKWKVLLTMENQGGWSQEFWRIADQTAAGGPPQGYEDGIGCR